MEHESAVDIVVRFSTNNQDIVLSFPSPSSTSILSLKQEIRSILAAPDANCRLRLIYSGKVLVDAASITKSLNGIPTAPPASTDVISRSEKQKGKQPLRNENQVARVYVHCSIGDLLNAEELSLEARSAQEADAALQTARNVTTESHIDLKATGGSTSTTTTPAPRGFDRLLSAGFTASEVAALRAQFLAIQAHTHTPDTMPSGAELLSVEERWLDNGSSAGNAGSPNEDGFGGDDTSGLDDMLYGNLIGFFWPIGAMCWLMREEGVWSRRRQIAVLSGILVNLTFGWLRVMN